MTDKDLENINTVNVKVTAESMDAHVICLKDNGYKVQKNSSVWTRNILFLLLGAFVMGSFLQ